MENGLLATVDPNYEITDQLKVMIFAAIISADNDDLDEHTKQEIIRRFYSYRAPIASPYIHWEDVLEPIEDDKIRERYFKLLD